MKIKHYHFACLDSTNLWSKQNIKLFNSNELSVITADEQRLGKGRRDREWVSPRGGLFSSFCFFVDGFKKEYMSLAKLMTVSAGKTLEKFDCPILIKMPNDLFLSGRKIAGVLGENSYYQDSLVFIIGVGVNVNVESQLLAKIDQPATSMMLELGNQVNMQQFLSELTMNFSQDLKLFLEKGFDPFNPYFDSRKF